MPSTISLALWVLGLASLTVQPGLRVTVRDASLWLTRTITVCRYVDLQIFNHTEETKYMMNKKYYDAKIHSIDWG